MMSPTSTKLSVTRKQTRIYIDEKLIERMKAYAHEHGLYKHRVLEAAISRYLDEAEKRPQE
ncbi:hypothetical protein WA1_18760 [Scytonema hofmannii PCC 7110]|uniref:Uncharacterized protein n=1 Tax=Scytonema hofmannii PCC 7110 TaxID=128403 RepID=A0A139XBH1_9CYAN|nr:hypothetical protein WA1_18760 [Scytonema hofmannii PCC 7110]